MRSRTNLFILLFVVILFALPVAAQAGIPFFGPIIPPGSSRCVAGWGMLIMVINNIISLLITIAIVFVAPLMIAYAGFLFVVNPVNAGGKEKAKGVLRNTVVGIVIALASWMIVDAVMVVLYNPDTEIGNSRLGAWSQLITSGDLARTTCIPLAESLSQAGPGRYVSGISATGVQYLAPVSGNCSTNSLIDYGINSSIANTMSCIAQFESSCNLTASNPNSSAFGLFQVVNGWNDTGHNLNFPVCTQVAQRAGYSVSGDLNCSRSVVTGGAPNQNNIPLYNACRVASSDPHCNAAAAQWLYDHGGFRMHWPQTAPRCGV